MGIDTTRLEQAYAASTDFAVDPIEEEKKKKIDDAYQASLGTLGTTAPQVVQERDVESKYDKGYLLSYGDLDAYRAESQGPVAEVGNKLAQVIPGIAMGTVEMLGYMGDLENVAGAVGLVETDFDNWLSEGLREAEKRWDKKFPVYSKNPEKVMDFGDSAWWVNNAGDTVESIMEFLGAGAVTGGAIGALGKGLQKLGAGMRLSAQGTKLAGITNNLSKAVYAGGTGISTPIANSFITAQGIGALNAYQVHEDLTRELTGKTNPETEKLFTPEEINTIASENAAGTYRATAFASTLLNATTLMPFTKKIGGGIIKPQQGTTMSTFLKKLKEVKANPQAVERGEKALKWYNKILKPNSTLTEMGQEGIEEINENWQQQLGVHRGLELAGQETKFDPWSEENILAFALGAFGGAVAKGGGSVYRRITDNTKEANFDDLLDRQIKTIEDHFRLNEEVKDLEALRSNTRLNPEQKAKVDRDYSQKINEWVANAAQVAFDTETHGMIIKDLKEQHLQMTEDANVRDSDKARVQKMIDIIENGAPVQEHLQSMDLPREVKQIAGESLLLKDAAQADFEADESRARTIYNTIGGNTDINRNSQIAALNELISTSSDGFVVQEAKKLKTKISKDIPEDADTQTINGALAMAEAQKYNNMILADKYQNMYDSLMDPDQREEVLKTAKLNRVVSEQMANRIAKREKVYTEVDDYLTKPLEEMTIKELNVLQKKLAIVKKPIKSPYVEDVQRDTGKMESRSRGVSLTIGKLQEEQKKAKETEAKQELAEGTKLTSGLQTASDALKETNEIKNSGKPVVVMGDPDAPGAAIPPAITPTAKPEVKKPAIVTTSQDPKEPKLDITEPVDALTSKPVDEGIKQEAIDDEKRKIGTPVKTEKPKEIKPTVDLEEQTEKEKTDVAEQTQVQTVLKETVQMATGLTDSDGKPIFTRLYTEDGNVVEQEYLPGLDNGSAATIFNRLYTTDYTKADPNSPKFSMDVYKEDVPIKTTFYRTMEPALPVTKVFKTDETGKLAILNPNTLNAEVVIIAEPTWKYWAKDDPDLVALNVYAREDIENGIPISDAKPLTQIPSTERKTKLVNTQTIELRNQFRENPNLQLETKLGSKTSGSLREDYQGNKYVKHSVLEFSKATGDTIPIFIMGKDLVGTVPEPVWERLSYSQKESIEQSNEVSGKFDAGASFLYLPNPAGEMTKVYLHNDTLTDQEVEHLTTIDGAENIFTKAFAEQTSAQGKDLPRIKDYFMLNTVKFTKSALRAAMYNPNSINIAGEYLTVKMPQEDGPEIFYLIRVTPFGERGYNQFNDMMNGKSFRVETFDINGTKIVLGKNVKGQDQSLFEVSGKQAQIIKGNILNQLQGTYRNVSRTSIESTGEFTDNITGASYDSYLDYIMETKVVHTGVNPESPFMDVGAWITTGANEQGIEDTLKNPEVEEKVQEQVKTLEEPKVTKPKQPRKKTPAKPALTKLEELEAKIRKQNEEKFRLFSPVPGFQVLSSSEIQWFKDTLGDQYLSIVKGIDRVMVNGQEAFGYYHNSIATIAETSETGTAYHEAFHLVFDLGMSPRQQQDLYTAARKKYKGGESMAELELEEAMADDFMVYRFNREGYKANSIITKFFRMLKNYINNLLGRRLSLDNIFQNISDGNVNLNQQSADIVPRPRLVLANSGRQESAINTMSFMFNEELNTLSEKMGMSTLNVLTLGKNTKRKTSRLNQILVKVHERVGNKISHYENTINIAAVDPETTEEQFEEWARNLVFFKDIRDNWKDTTTEKGLNIRDGLETLLKKSLSTNGFTVSVKERIKEGDIVKTVDRTIDPAQLDKVNPKDVVEPNPDLELIDETGEDPTEMTKDKIHDKNHFLENPKHTMAVDIRMALSAIPKYKVSKGEVVRDKAGNKVYDLNEYGEPEMIGDFDQVYSKMRDKLAGIPMDQMWTKLEDLATRDDDFALIKDYLSSRRQNGSNFYAKFMSNIYGDKGRFITIIVENEGFKVMETNRSTLPNQIIGTWKSQSDYLEKTTIEEAEIDLKKAAEAQTAIDKVKETYEPVIELRKRGNLASQHAIANKMVEDAAPALKVLGITIDPKVWSDMTKNKPAEYLTNVANMLLAVNRDKPGSVEQMVTTLSRGEDPYIEEKNNALMNLVNLVQDYETDNFSASFINGENKTVYSINLNSNLSKTMMEIQNNPDKFIQAKMQDSFYNPGTVEESNMFLQKLTKNKDLTQFTLHNFDTIKNRGVKSEGVPYDKTNNQESILARLLAFGHRGLINTGTKADKGRSLYIKLPKLSAEEITLVLQNTVKQERARIQRATQFGEHLPDNKAYKENAKKFLYIPAIQDILGAEESLFDQSNSNLDQAVEAPAIQAQIDEAIKIFQNKLVTDNMAMLEAEGVIIYETKEGTDERILTTPGIPSDFFGTADKETRLREFILNDFAWNLEMGKVFMGDLAFYKSESEEARTIDFFKRAYQTITPGQELFITQDPKETGTTKTHIRVITVKDPVVYNEKQYLKDLTAGFSKEAKQTATKEYGKIASALDATSWATVKAWKELHLGFGTWTREHEELYMNAWALEVSPEEALEMDYWQTTGGNMIDIKTEAAKQRVRDRISKVYLEAIKPFYFGDRTISLEGDVGNIQWFEQYKNSVIPIFPHMATDDNPGFRDALRTMEDNRVDLMVYDTAIKVGQYNSVNPEFKEGDKWSKGPTGQIKELPLSNYRVPQKISTKEGDANSGSQLNKITVGDLNLTEKVYTFNNKEVTGQEMMNEYNDAWTNKVTLSEKKLKKELLLGENPDGNWTLPQTRDAQRDFLLKLRELLTNENTKRQLHENYEENIQIEQDLEQLKFAVSLDFPAFSQRYESILMSLFRNNILKQKFPGASLVQMADQNVLTDKRLKFIKRGKDYQAAEVAVSQGFLKDKLELDLPVGDISAEDQKRLAVQLTMLGYRIPGQGKNSSLPLKIARVLPREQGSTIMVPAEITVQMGSDFDIDKMFVMTRSIDKKGDPVDYTEVAVTKAKQAIETKRVIAHEELTQKLAESEFGIDPESLKAEHARIDNEFDQRLLQAEHLNEKQLNNKILDVYLSILASDYHAEEVIAPLSSDLLEKEADRFKEEREGDHVSSLHTNIYQEYINKFAKAAVGITATYITGKTLYSGANVRLQNVKILNRLIDYDWETIDYDAKEAFSGYSLGAKYNSDNIRVSDILKVWNNAALDNAKDPILGHLNVNSHTINTALLMSSVGYKLSTVTNFINQPVIHRISEILALNPNYTYVKAKRELLKLNPALNKAYDLAESKEAKDGDTFEFTPKVLEDNLFKQIGTLTQEEIEAQARVLQLFDDTYEAGRDLSKVNKVLSPETAKNFSKFSAVEEFKNIARHVTNGSDWITVDPKIFNITEGAGEVAKFKFPTEKIQESPVPRVTAFYERGIVAAEEFSKSLFVNNSPAYKTVKQEIAKAIGARDENLSRDQIDTVNALLSYLMLTADNQLAETMYKGTDMKTVLFDQKSSLAARLTHLKSLNLPGFNKNALIRELNANEFNKNTIVQKIQFNNTTDRDIENRNKMTRAWLAMIEHPNAEVSKWAKDLVAYSVVTTGFQTGPGSFFDLIPSKYWVDSGLEKAWNKAKLNLEDDVYLVDSTQVIVRMAPWLLTSIEKPADLTKVSPGTKFTTKEIKIGDKIIYKGKGVPNTRITSMILPIKEYSEILVPGKSKLNRAPKPYIRMYNQVVMTKRSGSQYTNKKLSGNIIYQLVSFDAKLGTAAYQELQTLGERYNLVEGVVNEPFRKSRHPKNFGIASKVDTLYQLRQEQDEKYYWENAEIETKLKTYLGKLGVKVEAVDNLMEKFGVDAAGAADLTNSIIYLLNTKEGMNALPEEVAHFFVEGLGDQPLMQRLMARVEETPEYAEVVEQYGVLYNHDEAKLKREAAAKIIAKYLMQEKPAPKNWLRRILKQIKDLIHKVFKGRDPFREAANYILAANTEVLNAAPTSTTGVMYALDAEGREMFPFDKDYEGPIDKNIDPDRDKLLEKETKLKILEEHPAMKEFDFTATAFKNLEKQFNKEATKVASVVDKIKKGLFSKLRTMELTGRAKPEALLALQSDLDKLDGLTFLTNLSERALEIVDKISKEALSFDFENNTETDGLKFVSDSINQLGTFSHLDNLRKILENKRVADKDPSLVPIINQLKAATSAVNNTYSNLADLELKLYKQFMQKTSTRGFTEEEIDKTLEEITVKTGPLDKNLLALHDSSDEILAVMGKKLQIIENKAKQKFFDYLRGTEKNPGLAKLTAELQKVKKTTDLDKLYEDFVVWNPSLNKYQFVISPEEALGKLPKGKTKTFVTDKWNKLQALPKDSPIRRFYDYAVKPYLKERRELSAQKMDSLIGAFNNIPIRKKDSSETPMGSSEWAMRKLKNIKEKFTVQVDDVFIGAVDESGKPIRYIPYRYNYKGDLAQGDISMEIANGLALAMENIYEANEKREVLPLVEATINILAKREQFLTDSKGKKRLIERRSDKASRASEKFNVMADMFFYGEQDKELIVKGKDVRKIVRTAKEGIGFLNLGFNVASQIVNPIVQVYFAFSQALGQRHYSFKSFRQGFAMAYKKMPSMLADYHSKTPNSKDTLLMERLGVFSHGLEDINLGKKGNFMNNFMTKLGYAGFKIGNAMVQPGVAYSMMLDKKIPGMDMNFYEAFSMKNGSLVMNEKAKKAMGGEEEVALFVSQVQNAIRKVSDNRKMSDKGIAETHWAGKFMMMHRSWMVPMYMNLLKANHFNEVTGKWEEGKLRTAWNAIYESFKHGKLENLKHLAFQFDHLGTKDINPSTGKPFTEDQLALYKSNIKQAVMMAYSLVLLTLLKNFAWDEEDKKDDYLYYLTLRVKGEIFSMLDPRDFIRIARSPSAAVNNIENLYTAIRSATVGQITGEGRERLEKGAYKDWMKVTRDWSKFVPVYNQYLNLQKTSDRIKFMEQGF